MALISGPLKTGKYELQIDHVQKLIRYTPKGRVGLTDIRQAWDVLLTLEEFILKKYDLFSDFRNASITASPPDVEVMVEFLFKIKEILYRKRQVILVSDPESTAISMLFEGEVNQRIGFIVRVFTYESEAMKWISGQV